MSTAREDGEGLDEAGDDAGGGVRESSPMPTEDGGGSGYLRPDDGVGAEAEAEAGAAATSAAAAGAAGADGGGDGGGTGIVGDDAGGADEEESPAAEAGGEDTLTKKPKAGGEKRKRKMGRPKGSRTRQRWILVPVSSLPQYQRDDEDEGDGGDVGEGEGDTDASSEGSYCSDHQPSSPSRRRGRGIRKRSAPTSSSSMSKTGKSSPKRGNKKVKGMIRPPPKRPRTIRRRTHDSGTDDVEQPHVSMAYQAMDDALLEREAARRDIDEARRKLAEAQKVLDDAIAREKDMDVEIRRRRDDIMEAELAVPSRWNEMYRRLAAFQLEHGHTILSRRLPGLLSGTDDVDPELAKWVLDQRTHLKTKLDKHDPTNAVPRPDESESERRRRVMNRRSEYRIAALDKLGFVWNENEAFWDIQLRQLIEYKREHGDCHVPQRYKPNPALGKWVSGQRTHYRLLREGRPSQMTPERIRRLEEVGFAWESNFPRNTKDSSTRRQQPPPPRKKTEGELWEERCNQFAEFRATHGHGHLYQHRGVTGPMLQLCLWAGYQRKQYKLYKAGKPSLLTKERVERLDSLGFYWNVRGTRDDIPSRLRARAAAEAAAADGGGDAAPQDLENSTALDEGLDEVQEPVVDVSGALRQQEVDLNITVHGGDAP